MRARPSSPARRVYSLERAATLAAVYAAVVAITVPPLALMLLAVPTHRSAAVTQHARS